MNQLISSLLVAGLMVQVASAFDVDVYNQATAKSFKIANIDPTKTTVGALKVLIKEQVGVNVEDQRLGCNFKLIRGDEKLLTDLEDYNPTGMGMVLLRPIGTKSQIKLNFAAGWKRTTVSSNETLGFLRKKSIGEGRIFFDELELVDDGKTMKEYQVYVGATLYVFQKNDKIPVTVYYQDGTAELYHVSHNATIIDLKMRIHKSTHIFVSKQTLTMKGKELSDNMKILDLCPNPIEGLIVNLIVKQ